MKMKFAHWQMIFKRISAYFFFVLGALVRRMAFDRLKPDGLLIAEISAVGFFLILSFLRWLFFRYGFDGKEFVICKGILIKRRTVIPADNLSTADFERNINTLISGAVLLRIDTEAGCYKRSDFEFPVYKKDAERITCLLSGKKKPVIKTGFWRCVASTLTLSQAHIGALFALPIVNRIASIGGVSGSEILKEGLSRIERIGIRAFPVAVSAVFFIILVGFLINFVHLSLQYIGLKVDCDKDMLLVERGLFFKKRTIIKKGSIRACIIRETPALMLFKKGRVHALSAGYGKETGEVSMLSPADSMESQRIKIKKIFNEAFDEKPALCARRGSPKTQKVYYFLLISVLTAAALVASVLWKNSGLIAVIYFVALFLLSVRGYVYIANIADTGLSKDFQFARVIKGCSVCSLYFTGALPRELKINQNIFQKLSGSCTLKIYLRSEKRRSYTLYSVDYNKASKLLQNFSLGF